MEIVTSRRVSVYIMLKLFLKSLVNLENFAN